MNINLKRREKILLGSTAGLAVAVVLYLLVFAGDSRTDEQLTISKEKLASDLVRKDNEYKIALHEKQRFEDWKLRSLPPDAAHAGTLYQEWLSNLAKRNRFLNLNLTSNSQPARGDQYTKMSFYLHAQANLGEIVQFLYGFYSTGYLHQIRRMEIKRIKGLHELDVSLAIEALSLPKADSKDTLPDKIPKTAWKGLQHDKLSDYRDPIVKRDFFSVYVPPRPTPPTPIAGNDRPKIKPVDPPKPPPVDPAKFTIVTGFIGVDGEPQVWIWDKMADKQWKLNTGESFAVGTVKGTIQSIDPSGEAVIEFDGQLHRLHNGENLRQGLEIQTAPTIKPASAMNSTQSTAVGAN